MQFRMLVDKKITLQKPVALSSRAFLLHAIIVAEGQLRIFGTKEPRR